jgi:hypothetical protein
VSRSFELLFSIVLIPSVRVGRAIRRSGRFLSLDHDDVIVVMRSPNREHPLARLDVYATVNLMMLDATKPSDRLLGAFVQAESR